MDPIFMTEVNVDRSKPCSHSTVFPLVTGYFAVIGLEVVFMLKVGDISWFCSGLNLHLKQTAPRMLLCSPVFSSVGIHWHFEGTVYAFFMFNVEITVSSVVTGSFTSFQCNDCNPWCISE